MKDNKLYKMILTALFAALVCMTTMVIQIPSPMSGYVNLGDCFVLLSGWLLGPVYGFCAAGIGSMLADLFSGYAYYAPATFLIKGLMAAVAALLVKVLSPVLGRHIRISRTISAIAAEIIMIVGYFGYAALILGNGLAAASSIPGNAMQGIIGVVSAVLVIEMVTVTGLTKKLIGEGENYVGSNKTRS